ncbi:MAG: DEAD/DEAH box helicase, partial [Deltaproteobacteria bacterium]|nr:DEAD/DEAH box helicase [Deltaproteobacteria bacterium]
ALTPFSLTNAQERVLGEIYRDMASSQPMQRLMQGDVGSGKTIVAWFAALRAIENGFQAVLLAPTELLAEQHFLVLKAFADELNITTGLLIGSLPAREKEDLLVRIGKGEIAFVVGTHALIQEGVQVPRLGLGIIVETPRSGVSTHGAQAPFDWEELDRSLPGRIRYSSDQRNSHPQESGHDPLR